MNQAYFCFHVSLDGLLCFEVPKSTGTELNLNGGRTLNDCRAHTEQFVNDKRERRGEESAKL